MTAATAIQTVQQRGNKTTWNGTSKRTMAGLPSRTMRSDTTKTLQPLVARFFAFIAQRPTKLCHRWQSATAAKVRQFVAGRMRVEQGVSKRETAWACSAINVLCWCSASLAVASCQQNGWDGQTKTLTQMTHHWHKLTDFAIWVYFQLGSLFNTNIF